MTILWRILEMAIASTPGHLQPQDKACTCFPGFADPQTYIPIELTHNNARAGIIYVQADDTPNGVTGLAVIQVQQGDVVMVRSKPGYNPRGNIFSDNNMKTSFSGWCILC